MVGVGDAGKQDATADMTADSEELALLADSTECSEEMVSQVAAAMAVSNSGDWLHAHRRLELTWHSW